MVPINTFKFHSHYYYYFWKCWFEVSFPIHTLKKLKINSSKYNETKWKLHHFFNNIYSFSLSLSLYIYISIWAQTHLEEQEQTPFSYHCVTLVPMCDVFYPNPKISPKKIARNLSNLLHYQKKEKKFPNCFVEKNH
jgi:hypothetical protein